MRPVSEVHLDKDPHAHTNCGPDSYPDADRAPDSYPDRDFHSDRDCHGNRDDDSYRDPHGVTERQCLSGSDDGIDGRGDQREPG